MFELTINNQVYQFNFGLGFLREMNKRVMAPMDGVPGMKREVGFKYAVADLIDGSVDTLIDVLDVANKGQDPRLTKMALEAHVDDESTDIDQLFEDVLGFFQRSNATKKYTVAMIEAVEKEKEKQRNV